MNETRPSATALATYVVASESGGGAEERILGRLHAGLGRLVGSDGVAVLLARALRLAQQVEPRLATVTLGAHASVRGFPEPDKEALLVALLAQLFELLIRFIGEDLVSRVIGDIWPRIDGAAGPTETNE